MLKQRRILWKCFLQIMPAVFQAITESVEKCIYRNGKNFRNGDKNSVIKLSNFRTSFLVTFRVSYCCREEERLSKAPIGNVYIIYYILLVIYYILYFILPLPLLPLPRRGKIGQSSNWEHRRPRGPLHDGCLQPQS